jgi:UDP-N-acetylmuramoyl-tripeptide--D-alanyl-D-alanine ligase
MNPLTLEQIRRATNGKLLCADPATIIQSVCTDTRSITPGCLFIALKGDNHDGHDHVKAAMNAGAVAAMVHDDPGTSLPVIRVNNTRKAMGQLASFVRSTLKGKVIAVAGSNGKTGTKNLLHAALRNSLAGSISPKSFNNDIGVPTTIFAADPKADYLVLEIGTNHHGEISNLTHIAKPDVAIITNIGAEHLEFLGDLEGVRKENAQIIHGMNPAGLLVINGDSPGLADAVAAYAGEKITFGFDDANDLHPTQVVCQSDGVRFQIDGQELFIPLMGRHTAVNALAAIAVARHLRVCEADIIAGLGTATGPEMRLQLQTAGTVKILNDAYNANPHSMHAGLETLRDMEAAGRRVAILGDMRELGLSADRYHREVGQFAAECNLDYLVCAGEKAKLIADAAITAGMPADLIEHYATAADCAACVSSIIGDGDLVLLKASRWMQLETVAAAITVAAAAAGLRREVAARSRKVVREQLSSVR